MAPYRVLGRSALKLEGREKATGQAKYSGDLKLPGMLWGKILRSPYPHARIVRIDASQAEALPGVRAVCTAADVSPNPIGQFLEDRPVFAIDRVRHVGEPVAAVAADDPDLAEDALDLIDVEYEELEPIFSPLRAMEPDAPILHPRLAEYKDIGPRKCYGNVRQDVRIQRGDVEKAFAEADLVQEGRYTYQALHPGYIEPRAALATVDASGKLTVWCASKAPFRIRQNLATGLGMPIGKIRAITPTLGGDFGGKGGATVEPIAAALALKAGRPVKIVLTRTEELGTHYTRHAAAVELKTAVKKDGTILGVQGRVIFDNGGYSGGVRGLADKCANLQGAYLVPNVDLVSLTVYTNNPPAGQVRAPGAPQVLGAVETHMDAIARKLGLDPWEFRRRNALHDGDPSPASKVPLRNVGEVEAIDRARELALDLQKTSSDEGIGVAVGAWALGVEAGTASSAAVKFNEDGSVVLLTGVTENGGGQFTVMAQIVSEILGVPLEKISIVAQDTEACPFESGTGGSITTYRVGNTIKQAAEDARRQLFELAAERLEASPADLETADGKVSVKGSPEQAVPIAALAGAAMNARGGPILGTSLVERQQWFAKKESVGPTADVPVFVAQAAKVRVDPETGKVSLLDYVAVQDVGYALNPLGVEGQILGGTAHAIGWAISEELKHQNGKIINPSFADYKLPSALDIPPIRIGIVEKGSELGPYGAKGVGEPCCTVASAVIANAVADAVGVHVADSPILPERVYWAMKKRP